MSLIGRIKDRFATERTLIGEVKVTWPKVEGATSYDVFRLEDSYKVVALPSGEVQVVPVEVRTVTQTKKWWQKWGDE